MSRRAANSQLRYWRCTRKRRHLSRGEAQRHIENVRRKFSDNEMRAAAAFMLAIAKGKKHGLRSVSLCPFSQFEPDGCEVITHALMAADTPAHLYLWVPNALLPDGLEVMRAWGFTYKTNIIWHKVRKDGGPDGRGVGFYFRNTTEMILFGIRGSQRTLAPGRKQVNIIRSQKQEHSRKPDELYEIIESCSPGPFIELFARGTRPGWYTWGNQAENYEITWETYKNNSQGNVVDFRRKKEEEIGLFALVG